MSEPKDNFDYKQKLDKNLLDHDYDGIKELDNPIPGWSMAIFYITIAFSIVYGIYYFAMDGPTQYDEYAQESAEHDAKYKALNKSTDDLKLLTDKSLIEEGRIVFTEMNCAICHGASGEGTATGPNLTDDAWLEGCSFEDVFKVLKNGKNGMPAFKTQMSDTKIQKVASFVLTELKGATPENPKAPEGTPCK